MRKLRRDLPVRIEYLGPLMKFPRSNRFCRRRVNWFSWEQSKIKKRLKKEKGFRPWMYRNAYLVILATVTFLLWHLDKATGKGSSVDSTRRTVPSLRETEENIPELSKKVSSSSRQKASQATYRRRIRVRFKLFDLFFFFYLFFFFF